MFVSAYAGALVSPALIGFAADRVGLRAAMMIPLIAAVVVVSLAGNLSLVFLSGGAAKTAPRPTDVTPAPSVSTMKAVLPGRAAACSSRRPMMFRLVDMIK